MLEPPVSTREGRRDGDGVARVDAHRVEILDGADDHTLVLVVAHDLHLVFLPTEETLLDEHLMGRRGLEAAVDDLLEFLAVVGDAAAGAAEREARADDERESADLLGREAGLLQRMDDAGLGHIETDAKHGLLEEIAILAHLDRRRFGADHLAAVFFQDAGLVQRHREVERGLAAQRGQQRGRALLGDDLLENLDRERLDVGDIGKLRVGHDRGRVGVHEDDLVTLFLEGLARLGAGIVKFTGLADDNGTGADDEDGLKVGAFGHARRFR
jgi:hypothetical protein